MGADKGSNKQRRKEVEKLPMRCICGGHHPHGKWTWHSNKWHDYYRKGTKEISDVFRPSKPKETK